jgi:Predicted permease
MGSAWSPARSWSERRSVTASFYGVKLELNNFAKSLFYYLFMYGVGLRVGPSFINSLKGDGLKFTFLAVVSSVWAWRWW